MQETMIGSNAIDNQTTTTFTDMAPHPLDDTQPLAVPAGSLADTPQPAQSPHPLARPVNTSLANSMARKLAEGEPIAIGPKGQASGQGNSNTLSCPDGHLANGQPHPLARPQTAPATNSSLAASLARKLAEGKPVAVGGNGKATTSQGTDTLAIPRGELAVRGGNTLHVPAGRLCAQWYQTNPRLLAVEIASVKSSVFSDFNLKMASDGCYYWDGYIQPGIMQDGYWHVCALYPPNFPTPTMGGTMRIYLIDPSLKQIEDTLGVTLHHVLRDMDGDRYLCTARREDVEHIRRGNTALYTGAVTSLVLATKWLTALELVLTGHMSLQLFNSPGGI